MYWRDKNSIPNKILDVQRQEIGYDCGLFAVANLIELCFNVDNNSRLKPLSNQNV